MLPPWRGSRLGDYVRSGELLARCQIQALKHYDYDAVFALMDTSVETEAVGSVLTYRADQYPSVRTYALSDGADLEGLSVPDPHRAGRMPELLEAVKILRREVGDDVLVVGCVLGPMTLATQLLGIEAALYLAIDEPERFSRLLDFATEIVIQFGISQIEAGAHLPMVFNPSASPAVIPLPILPRNSSYLVFARCSQPSRRRVPQPTGFISPGRLEPILSLYPQAGVDIANIDYEVDPLDAQRALPQICLDGNIKPLDFVEATPDVIADESSGLMNLFADRGGFIMSSGCEIPPESKPENIAAMVAAVR